MTTTTTLVSCHNHENYSVKNKIKNLMKFRRATEKSSLININKKFNVLSVSIYKYIVA